MADTEMEFKYTSKTRTQGQAGPNLSGTSYGNVGALRTALASANGSYFTTARLNAMTKNDMVYALRLIQDAGTI